MDIQPPPPPPPLPYLIGVTPTTTTTTATTTTPPQAYNNNGGIAANIPQIPHHHHHTSSHSPSGSSIIIVMIVISSAIIVSATIYLLIRFLSRRCNRSSEDVVPNSRNQNDNGIGNENVRHHAICVDSDDKGAESLPLFTFSSLTGKIAGGDCAVCLSKFEGVDQLRLLPLCCHAFHAECIDAWLKSNQTCPLCRSTVNPTEADVLNRLSSVASGGRLGGNRSSSFRIEIGNVSQRREGSDSDRRSYSIGSYEYVLDDAGYEIPVESTHHRRGGSVDKDSTVAAPEPPGNNVAAEVGGGSGRRNWLRDYVDRFSVSRSSRSQSFRGGSGRFFGGSLRRSETAEDYEATHGRIGEEISELFRWFSGV